VCETCVIVYELSLFYTQIMTLKKQRQSGAIEIFYGLDLTNEFTENSFFCHGGTSWTWAIVPAPVDMSIGLGHKTRPIMACGMVLGVEAVVFHRDMPKASCPRLGGISRYQIITATSWPTVREN
jgi:hypothetical protein